MFHRFKHLILITVGVAALAGGPAAVIANAEPVGSGGYDCKAGQTWFDQRVADYNKYKDTNPVAASDAKKDADNEKTRATAAGCDTKNWVVPKRVITTSVYFPISPISVTPVSRVSGFKSTPGPSAAAGRSARTR